jgi:NifU-like protein
MLIGKTIEEARKITNKDIADALGGLPDEKMHCSVMGYEALEDALKGFGGVALSGEKIICHCYHISERKVLEAIEKNGLKTLEQITENLYAGGAVYFKGK